MVFCFYTVLSGLEKYGFEIRQKHIHKPAVRIKPKGKKVTADAYQEALEEPQFVEVKIEVDNPTEEEPSSSYHLAESLMPPVPETYHNDDIEEPMDLDEFNEHLTDEDDCQEEPVENEDKDGNMSMLRASNSSSEEEKEEESEDDDDDYYNPIHKASYSEG